MKSADKIKSEDFYKLFKPYLTPQKMLEMGVFGGSYFGNKINEYPKSWFKNAKLRKTFHIEKNRFKVKAGLSRKEVIDYESVTTCDTDFFKRYFCAMLEEGVYIAPSQFEAGFMSTVHTDEDIEKTIACSKKALERSLNH